MLLPLPMRLARRLLAAKHAHDLSATGVPQEPAALRLSQEDTGQMLGVSRQSVNRQLKEWEAQGMLRLDYGRVTLLDRAALRRRPELGSMSGRRRGSHPGRCLSRPRIPHRPGADIARHRHHAGLHRAEDRRFDRARVHDAVVFAADEIDVGAVHDHDALRRLACLRRHREVWIEPPGSYR